MFIGSFIGKQREGGTLTDNYPIYTLTNKQTNKQNHQWMPNEINLCK